MPDALDRLDTDATASSGDALDRLASQPYGTDRLDKLMPKPVPPNQAMVKALATSAAQEEQNTEHGQEMDAHDADMLTSIAQDPVGFVKSVPSSAVKFAAGMVGEMAKQPYLAAADAMAKATGDPEYGGNLKAEWSKQNPDDPLPVDKFFTDVSKTSRAAGVVGKLSEGIAETGPMLAVAGLPAAARQLVARAFTVDMLAHVPGTAQDLYTELKKPADQQDQDKITSLISEGAQQLGFGALGAAHEAVGLYRKYMPEAQYAAAVAGGYLPKDEPGVNYDLRKGSMPMDIIPSGLLPERSTEGLDIPGETPANEPNPAPAAPPSDQTPEAVAKPDALDKVAAQATPEPEAVQPQAVPPPVAVPAPQPAPAPVDKTPPTTQITPQDNNEQPNTVIPVPATPAPAPAGVGQPGANPPGMDVREPAGPGAPNVPVGPAPPALGRQDATGTPPNGPTQIGGGNVGGLSVRGGDTGDISAPGRTGLSGQSPGAPAVPGATPDQTQHLAPPVPEDLAVARKLLEDHGKLSVSILQRKANMGYERAVGVIKHLADNGEISRASGTEPWTKAGVPAAETPPPTSQPPPEKTPPEPTSDVITGQNHVLPADHDWIPTGDKAKVRANLDAIKLLKQLEAENRPASPAEQEVLAKYTGWGGLKEMFDEGKAAYRQRPPMFEDQKREAANWEKAWGKLYDELNATLTPEEHSAASASILNAHYTAREIINGVWAAVKHLGFKQGVVLEPAAGVGNFIGLTPADVKARWHAVELDKISGRILGKLYPHSLRMVTGFEKAHLPVNSHDLAISNVPFAADGPFDKRYPKLSLHNYFFARALDLVKPGGLIAFITSDSTMDSPASKKAREYLSERADLVGAIRLPNDAFKKNAGTEVTTDIIFLRKKDATPFQGEAFTRTADVPIAKGEPVNINEYFAQHPEMMLGRMSREGTMYRADQQALVSTPGDIVQKLADAVAKLPPNVMGQSTPAEALAKPVVSADAGSKIGGLVYKDGGIHQVQPDGTLEKPEWAGQAAKVAQAKRYIDVRDRAKEHIALMLNPDATEAQIAQHRVELNRVYDEYQKRHGSVNERASNFLDDDVDYPLVLSLEDGTTTLVKGMRKGKEVDRRVTSWAKGLMFTKRTIFPRVAPDRADTVSDGLQISQNFAGRVDPEYIAKLTGRSLDAVKQELANSGQAFENPATGQWDNRATYLSGFVKEKLKQARIAVADNPIYEKNVTELEKVQPAPLNITQIGVKLGSTWVPPGIIEQFLQDILNVQARVSFTQETGDWHVTPIGGQAGERNRTLYGIHDWKGHELVESALNLKNPTVTKTVPAEGGGTTEVKDPVRSLEAREKQSQLQTEFKKWVITTPKAANELEQIFNEHFNGTVAPKFEAPTWAHYPNATTDIQLREHQKGVVTRMLQNSTLLAHAVGTGKTYAMITAAMEMRRLGLAKKPMIVVQNATLEQFARAFKKLYPASRVLCPGAKQRTAKERNRTMSRIATGDWDGVVVPQSFVNLLPDSVERDQQYIQDRVDELELAKIEANRQEGKKSPKAADLERAIKKLKDRLDALVARKKDNVLTFEQLGVDALFVDEAHEYKKNEFYTKMENIKGLDTSFSQRGHSMFMKTRWVQEHNQGRNVTFATGTPVSNTMAEAWNMMRYLRPDVLEKFHIQSFDDFASAFGDTVTNLEMTAAGTFRPVMRFARFVNGPELISAWRTVADVVTAEEVKLPGLPALKNGKETPHVIKLTPRLKAYVGHLREQLERFAAMSGKEKRENSHIPLVTFGLGRKCTLDMRMIDPSLPDEPGSKLNECADTVLRIYQDSRAVKGAQMVFADMYQDDPDNPRFNVYEEMKKKLIERGIPADEIAILTPDLKDEKKDALFTKVNNGDIAVVFGSSSKMGVGVNAQEHLIALHHLDAPARPMDIEQRNGRILRQGNLNPEVEIHTYGVENTLDAAMFQLLATKQRFINQIMRGDIQGRNFEDASNEATLNFEQQMAEYSGDPRAKERVGLENQVRSLESLRSGHYEQVRKARETIQNLTGRVIPYQEKQVAQAKASAETFAKAFATPNQFKLEIGERTIEGRKDISETMDKVFKRGIELAHKWAVDNNQFGQFSVPVGKVTLNGQPIDLTASGRGDFKGIIKPEDIVVAWKFPDGNGGQSTTGAGFFTSLSAVLERIAGEPQRAAASLANEQRNLRELSGFVQQPFEREAELAGAQKRLGELNEEVKAEGEAASKAAQAKIQADRSIPSIPQPQDGDEIEENMGSGTARPKAPRAPRAPKPVTVRDIEEPASALIKDINWFRAAVAPQTLGEPAKFLADLMRMLGAQEANDMARADKSLRPFRNTFDRTPVPKSWKYDPTAPLPRNYAFIAAYEGGDAALLGPTEAKLAVEFAHWNEHDVDRVQALGTGALETVYENYFPHLWSDPVRAQSVIGQFLSKNPLAGSKSFLKARTHALFIHGLAAGLRPVHDNPVDMWLLKKREIGRFIFAHKVVQGMMAAGWCPFVHVFSKPEPGMSTFNDAAFQKYGPPWVPVKEAFDNGMRQATIDLLQSLGVPHERLTKIGGQRWGYSTHFQGQSGNETITTKFGGPDFVMWHELGHVLDNRYPDLRDMLTATDTMETELRALADLRLDDPTKATATEQRYVRSMPEKMAVVAQAYIHAPAEMERVAPTVKLAFSNFIKAHPELAKINEIRPTLSLGEAEARLSVGGLIKLGSYYMPDAAAAVMRNYLSPGLNPRLWYRSLRELTHFMNGVQLGFSAFHLGYTSIDAALSRFAIALKYLDAGHPLTAIGKLLSVPLAPVTNIMQGAKLRSAVLNGAPDLDMAKLVHMLEAGGGRIGQDAFWQTQFTRRMIRAINAGTASGYISGTLLAPFAVFEQSLRPIMDYVVPRQKLGVFCELAKFELLKMKGDETPAQVRAIMGKCWDLVDNRMGQVVYDNHFYNKSLKDVILLSFRSYGWQQGKYAIAAHASADTAVALKQIGQGKRPALTHDMSYVMALVLGLGFLGGLITYLATGTKPKGKDYYMPRVGGTDANGNPLRFNFPTIAKDYIASQKHPLTAFGHSLTPLVTPVLDLYNNRDFWNVQIRNPDDPLWKQGSEVATYAAKQFVPFSVSGMMQARKDSAPAWLHIAPYFGFTPVPSQMMMSPAQELAAEITASAMPTEPRTQAQYEKSQTIKDAVKVIKAGTPALAKDILLRGGLNPTNLDAAAAQTIISRLNYNPLQFQVHNMTAPAAMRVWRLADTNEQAQLKAIIAAKVMNSKTLDIPTKTNYIGELKK